MAFAAIQALAEINEEQAQRLAALEEQQAALLEQMQVLETQEEPQTVWGVLLPLLVLAVVAVGFLLGRKIGSGVLIE